MIIVRRMWTEREEERICLSSKDKRIFLSFQWFTESYFQPVNLKTAIIIGVDELQQIHIEVFSNEFSKRTSY